MARKAPEIIEVDTSQLEALLRKHKIDRNDAFGQLVIVGSDLVGSLTVTKLLPE